MCRNLTCGPCEAMVQPPKGVDIHRFQNHCSSTSECRHNGNYISFLFYNCIYFLFPSLFVCLSIYLCVGVCVCMKWVSPHLCRGQSTTWRIYSLHLMWFQRLNSNRQACLLPLSLPAGMTIRFQQKFTVNIPNISVFRGWLGTSG